MPFCTGATSMARGTDSVNPVGLGDQSVSSMTTLRRLPGEPMPQLVLVKATAKPEARRGLIGR